MTPPAKLFLTCAMFPLALLGKDTQHPNLPRPDQVDKPE
ncbi:uncharacterized protein METZ01_LOCUS304831, partial [marine metagenome]